MKLLVVLLLVVGANGSVYDRCQWAWILKDYEMDGYNGVSLADWMCLTKWESGWDNQAVNHEADSTDYGIFQINSKWWCTDGQTHSSNACKVSCSDLLGDNLDPAINCAKRVVRDPAGVAAWVSWRDHCRDQDLSSYVDGCGL